MSTPGLFEWIIILGVIVLLFGTSKLPQLGSALGETIKNFKKGIKEVESEATSLKKKEPEPTKSDSFTPTPKS